MTNYKNRIENYTSIYKDTILDIESTVYESDTYRTVLELNASSRYLWLLKENKVKIDSFIVHCITPTKSVDIEFDIDQCNIEIEEIEYNEKNGEVLLMTTQPKSLKNWVSKN